MMLTGREKEGEEKKKDTLTGVRRTTVEDRSEDVEMRNQYTE